MYNHTDLLDSLTVLEPKKNLPFPKMVKSAIFNLETKIYVTSVATFN
jgi:hypothetical protein